MFERNLDIGFIGEGGGAVPLFSGTEECGYSCLCDSDNTFLNKEDTALCCPHLTESPVRGRSTAFSCLFTLSLNCPLHDTLLYKLIEKNGNNGQQNKNKKRGTQQVI